MSYTARDEITTAVETTVQNALETERTEPYVFPPLTF